MAKPKREIVERTEDWAQLKRHLKWPEQIIYELIRPVVIFGETAGERAHATGHTRGRLTGKRTASTALVCRVCSPIRRRPRTVNYTRILAACRHLCANSS